MKKMILGFAAMLGFTLASSFAFAGGDAVAGQGKTAMCAGCHGADGNSAVANFPKLAGQGENTSLSNYKILNPVVVPW